MNHPRLLLAILLAFLASCGEEVPDDTGQEANAPVKPPAYPDLSNSDVLMAAIAKATDFHQLERRDGLRYLSGSDVPYDGWATGHYSNGQTEGIGRFVKGKEDGPCRFWHENGQTNMEGAYVDGERHGLWIYRDKTGAETKREAYQAGKLLNNDSNN